MTCTCSSSLEKQIGIFEVSEIAETEILVQEAMQTTAAPTTTAAATTAGETTDSSDSNDEATTATPEEGVTTPSSVENRGETTDAPESIIQSTPISFSFPADYGTVISSFPSRDAARQDICDNTRSKLDLTVDEFQNCNITSGSIVVSFTLVQDETTGNQTVSQIQVQVNDGTLTLTMNGEEYTVIQDSYYVNNMRQTPPPPTEEDDDDTVVIVVVVVIIVVLILVVVVVLFFVMKKNQNESNKIEPNDPDYKKLNKKDGSPRKSLSNCFRAKVYSIIEIFF